MSPDRRIDRNRRNRALRLVFAVTVGLFVETLRGSALPPLAPVFAIQLLAVPGAAPKPKTLALAFGATVALAGVAYLVSRMTLGFPGLYAMGVGLLYVWCFTLAFHPRLAMVGRLGVMMAAVVTSVAAASLDLAAALLPAMMGGLLGGFALTLVAHALFPHDDRTEDATPAGVDGPAAPAPSTLQRAVLAALVILPLQLYLVSDGLPALVVLLTTGTLLMQQGLAESTRYGGAFAAGNGIGAGLAAVSAAVVSLHASPPLLLFATAAVTLGLAGAIVATPRMAAVFVPGLVAYTMLFGLTLSPLPLADGVAVAKRVLLILAAAGYALGAVSVLAPLIAKVSAAAVRAGRSARRAAAAGG
jgi:hypothetical protein